MSEASETLVAYPRDLRELDRIGIDIRPMIGKGKVQFVNDENGGNNGNSKI